MKDRYCSTPSSSHTPASASCSIRLVSGAVRAATSPAPSLPRHAARPPATAISLILALLGDGTRYPETAGGPLSWRRPLMSYKRVEGRYDRFKRYLELSFSSAPPARKALVARILTTQTINCPG